ncbi:acyl-CoA desaturase [Candidatus Acetothermia bacterium]|nr:acyl-CoA desaturase [Candidatus Acetothermia bacterium]MBI3642657.1 acyl-CoA desaturase [Candidatus Acetothermia bacterium]
MAVNLTMPGGDSSGEKKFPSDYAHLKWQVTQAGLYEKKPLYYWIKIPLTIAAFGASIAVLFLTHILWIQLLNALFFAFCSAQIGLIMHDAGHMQIFKNPKNNNLLNLFVSDLLVALCYSWWVQKHNQHHSHPNFEDLDPDINFPFLAYSHAQALERRGISRFIVKYQAFFLLPMFALVAPLLRWEGLQYLLKGRSKDTWLELFMLFASVAIYFAILFTQLPLLVALAFIVVQQVSAGIYLGMIFAPNHKGMPVFEADAKVDFLRLQVLTARNVKGNLINDFVYGGLNYQIEHHLFPNMPRLNLRLAQPIVQKFCKEHKIDYHETGVFRSLVEIFEYMHEMGAPLRRPSKVLAKE